MIKKIIACIFLFSVFSIGYTAGNTSTDNTSTKEKPLTNRLANQTNSSYSCKDDFTINCDIKEQDGRKYLLVEVKTQQKPTGVPITFKDVQTKCTMISAQMQIYFK